MQHGPKSKLMSKAVTIGLGPNHNNDPKPTITMNTLLIAICQIKPNCLVSEINVFLTKFSGSREVQEHRNVPYLASEFSCRVVSATKGYLVHYCIFY
ncbi:hypothetical protein Q3G72_021363 [Acer saccharum]|nr:hypothetical protein Q3G72_021363 [Acer saccharum]